MSTLNNDTITDAAPRKTYLFQIFAYGVLVILCGGAATWAQADLEVTNIDTSGTTIDLQSLAISGSVSVEVTSSGNTDAFGTFTILLFEDSNDSGNFEAGLDNILGSTTAADLAVGTSVTVAATVEGTVLFRDNLVYVFVDSNDSVAESDESNNLSNSGIECESEPSVGSFEPVLEWEWSSSPVFSDWLNVMMTPAVIDLTADGNADVIFGSTSSTSGSPFQLGVLRALNGNDGSEIFTVTDSAFHINASFSLAAGDIDLDGRPEIVAADSSGERLIAFEHDGSFKWRSPILENLVAGASSIADLDQDGTPEIIVGRQVLDNTGKLLWTGTGGSAQQGAGPFSGVADIDGDGIPEVVAGNTAYRADGTILWTAPVPDGLIGIGNFDDDTYPEVAVVRSGHVYLVDQDGSLIWGPSPIPSGGGGPPTISDYDSDGWAEIGVAGATRYAVFDTDGSLLWAAETQDLTSARTGSSVFDFDGDGAAEVVYSDEISVSIFRGSDGAVLWSTPLKSCTWYEYPVVADVDSDGNAEIVAVANTNCGGGFDRGIRVYGEANDNWVATRELWNQHTYHITNINDDGTIPTIENDNWRHPVEDPFNNYRQNRLDLSVFAAPDVSASRLSCAQSDHESYVTARIGNGGAIVVGAGLPVSFYAGAPEAGGVLLGTTNTSRNLEPGEFEDVALKLGPGFDFSAEIHATADDRGGLIGTANECDETNNRHSFAGCMPRGAIEVQKTAEPSRIKGSEGIVSYTVTVENTWLLDFVLDTVFDDRFGDVSANCVPALPVTMAPGDLLLCTFDRLVSGSNTEPHVNVVTAAGLDENGVPVEDSDDATVTFALCTDSECCETDDFNDDAVDATWTLDDLGDATDSSFDESLGELHLTGTGSELYHGTDNAAFLHRSASGNFRVEVNITGESSISADPYRKGGLMVRESMDPLAPRVMVNYLPSFPGLASSQPALQFDVRTSQGGTAVELASTVVGITLPVRVAIQRRDDELTVYYSTNDGASWTAPLGALGGLAIVPMTDDVVAGLVVASNDPAAPMAVRFDDFSLCCPEPKPQNEPRPCFDQPLDWVYLMDVSGTMVEPHGAFANDELKIESTAAALTALSESLGALEDGSRGALVAYSGKSNPLYNLAQGAWVASGFTDDFVDLSAAIAATAESPIEELDTTPAAIGLQKVLEFLMIERDPTHGVVVVWTTDNLPNIDDEGHGPLDYTYSELQELDLTESSGVFLSPGDVAWLGTYNAPIATYDGEPVADAMQAIVDLRRDQGDLRIVSLVPRGDGFDTPLLTEQLLDFAAQYTQGAVFGGTSKAELVAEVPSLLTAVNCGQERDAQLSGTVWHDLNADGVRNSGEPGVAGVTVTIGTGSVETDLNGRFAAWIAEGSFSVSVDSGDLPAGIDQATADPDGITSPHTAALTVGPWQVVSGLDFGYAEPAGGPLVGCEDDDFDDGTLDGAWSLAELGNADQGSVDESAGTLKLTGDGTTAYAGTDNGVFIYRGVRGDFRAEVDVVDFPVNAGGAYRKAGLMVRGGLGDLAPRVMVQYVPDFGGSGPALQFRARAIDGGPGDVALGSNLFGVSLPIRLAIERTGSTYSVQFSSDGGTTWAHPAGGSGGMINTDLGSQPLVGMNTVSYSADTALTAEFDGFIVCGEPTP